MPNGIANPLFLSTTLCSFLQAVSACVLLGTAVALYMCIDFSPLFFCFFVLLYLSEKETHCVLFFLIK
jgi:hypothetical protein